MNNIYVDKSLDTYVIKQEIKDLKGKKYRWVQIFLPETDFVQVLSITDRLAEERKKVVQEIREKLCKCDEYDCCCIDNMNINEVHKFLDQIEGASDERTNK